MLEGAQHHHSGVSQATVYRNIQSLVEEGWLTPVEVPGDSTRYEVGGKEHHHFQCSRCKKLYDLNGCLPFKPKLPRGFRITGHEFFFYGLCAKCSR